MVSNSSRFGEPASQYRWPALLALGAFVLICLIGQWAYSRLVQGVSPGAGGTLGVGLARLLFQLGPLLLVAVMLSPGAMRALRLDPVLEAVRRWLDRRGTAPALAAGAFGLSLIAVWALRAFANSGDEYNYVFIADTFRQGRLWNAIPEQPDLFAFFHLFMQEGKWVGQYEPGWPLIMAAFGAIGLPYWLAGPALGLACLGLVYRAARDRGDRMAGTLAVAIAGLSAFFIFNAASYFAHVYVGLFAVWLCWCAERFRRAPTSATALGIGFAVSAMVLSRPFDAILVCLPVFGGLLLGIRWSHWRYVPAAALGAAPALAIFLYYNDAITGHALMPVTAWGYPLLKLGFHSVDEWGGHFTLVDTIGHAAKRFVMLAEWVSPLFLLLYALAMLHLVRRRLLRAADLVFPVFVLGFLLFPALGGNQYGPRYYFEAFPLMAISCGTAAADVMAREWPARRARLALGLVLIHLVLSAAAIGPLGSAMRRIIDERLDLYDQVARRDLQNAVVIVASPTGAIRPMQPRDLTRNGVALTGPVIYALDRPQGRERLKALFPERTIWLYRRAPEAAMGRLEPAD